MGKKEIIEWLAKRWSLSIRSVEYLKSRTMKQLKIYMEQSRPPETGLPAQAGEVGV